MAATMSFRGVVVSPAAPTSLSATATSSVLPDFATAVRLVVAAADGQPAPALLKTFAEAAQTAVAQGARTGHVVINAVAASVASAPTDTVVAVAGHAARLFIAAETTTMRRALCRVLEEGAKAAPQGTVAAFEREIRVLVATLQLQAGAVADDVVPLRSLDVLVHVCSADGWTLLRPALWNCLADAIGPCLRMCCAQFLLELQAASSPEGAAAARSPADLNTAVFQCAKGLSQLIRADPSVTTAWLKATTTLASGQAATWCGIFLDLFGGAIASAQLTIETCFACLLLRCNLLQLQLASSAFVAEWFKYTTETLAVNGRINEILGLRVFLAVASPAMLLEPMSPSSASVLQAIFPRIVEYCEIGSALNTAHQNVSINALLELVAAAIQTLNAAAKAPEYSHVIDAIDRDWSARLLLFLRSHWDDPADGIATRISESFERFVKLQSLLDQLRPPQPGAQTRLASILAGLIDLAVFQEKKGFFVTLLLRTRASQNTASSQSCSNILLPPRSSPTTHSCFVIWLWRSGILYFSFVTKLLYRDNRFSTVCSEAALHLLERHLKELHTQHPGDEVTAIKLLDEAWISIVCEGLCSANSLLRKHIVIYLVPGLVKINPGALGRLFSTLARNAVYFYMSGF